MVTTAIPRHNDVAPSPKSVMSSPNLAGNGAATGRESATPFKLSNLLNFKDDKKSSEDRSAEVARLTAADAITGTLSMHLKDLDKKKLFYVKSKYHVVVQATKPTVDLFTSYVRPWHVSPPAHHRFLRRDHPDASPAFVLSLCKSSLVPDPKAAADGTFILQVHAWTKQATVHYRPQLFVFHDEKHHRVAAWIACLQRAIAAAADMDEGQVLTAGLADALSISSADDGDDLQDDHPLSMYVDSESAMSSDDDEDVGDAVARTLKKLNPFSPRASSSPASNPPSLSHRSSGNAGFKPCPNSTRDPPQSPLGRLNRALQGKKAAPSLDKAGSHPVLSLEERCELLRQQNYDKVQDQQLTDPVDTTATHSGDVAPLIRPREPNGSKAAASSPNNQRIRTFLHQVRAVLWHPTGGSGLLLSFMSGFVGASVVCPVAVAGFYHAHGTHNEDATMAIGYPGLVAAFVFVHVMAASGMIMGGLSVVGVLVLISNVTTQEAKRRRLRSDMRQLTLAEKSNFANCPTVEDSIMYYVNPMLETSTPPMLSSMVLTGLEMGDTPPSFGGIKCIPDDSVLPHGPVTEVSFDAEVRFVAGDDQLAELKLISHMGSAAARVRLKDAVIMGTMRITLRPMASVWPGFSGISLSFIRLQTFILDMVTTTLVWPKVLDIPFWDPALYPVVGVDDLPPAPSSPSAASTSHHHAADEKKSVFGPGVVSLHVRKLTVLPPLAPTTSSPSSDTTTTLAAAEVYCIVTLSQSHKTEIRVVDSNGMCTLDEKYEFYWDAVAAPTLHVEVWQHQRSVPDHAWGTAIIPLGPLAAKRDHELKVDVDLGDGVRGVLHVHVCRRLFSTVQVARTVTSRPKKSLIQGLGHDVCVGMLFVTWQSVVWACGDDDGSASVHGVFSCEKQRSPSTVQAKVKATTWQEMFSFFVYSVDTATLVVEIFEKAPTSRSESLGTVTLSVLELRKRLTTSQNAITESFALQPPHPDTTELTTPSTAMSVTLMFQWRQLMS
ncbi:hypothetical protein DYB25_000027 [Aphanomyces astaci]|uniref:C2 domain-containing protein n=2 Tax=Aphanomyces astaci TaxID=112090 RepID=A0A397F2Z9_APHAT|nr:hypothetical protein DYB25_000027 [Aphanomyces astaci]RHY55593.1 hypothetical protein DYB34_001488 [Aphanomyces astaci]RHZ08680.1 hypothetical protein DYB31_000147 [Aphanomyces astaci]